MAIDGGLRNLFNQKLMKYGCHGQSIESGAVGRGIPDWNYCVDGVEGWIEFKKTTANAVRIKPEQSAWISQRVRSGGNVIIGVRKKCTAGVRRKSCDILYLIHGESVELLRSGGLRANIKVLGAYEGGPSKWDWFQVLNILKGK